MLTFSVYLLAYFSPRLRVNISSLPGTMAAPLTHLTVVFVEIKHSFSKFSSHGEVYTYTTSIQNIVLMFQMVFTPQNACLVVVNVSDLVKA